MNASFSRPALTDWLIATLTTDTLPIGNGVGPDGAGWPNATNIAGTTFNPWAVLSPAGAQQRNNGPLADDTGNWAVSYTLRSVGGYADQADKLADSLRTGIAAIERQTLDLSGPWRLTRAYTRSYGPLVRVDAVNPPLWEVGDTVEIWLDRARSF